MMAAITINRNKAQNLHKGFSQYMERQPPGIPFVDFRHEFLEKDELSDKRDIYSKARKILDLPHWPEWIESSPGKIINVLREVCDSSVAKNLIIAKFRQRNGPQSALYRVDTPEAKRALEAVLYDLFLGFGDDETMFGIRFDSLAHHLRTNSLGCNWTFMSYLSFLAFQRRCFPIRPTVFDKTLEAYGRDERLSGYVSWKRYRIALGLADAVREYLAPMHGVADSIEIQSYLWVIGRLLDEGEIHDEQGERSNYDLGG